MLGDTLIHVNEQNKSEARRMLETYLLIINDIDFFPKAAVRLNTERIFL